MLQMNLFVLNIHEMYNRFVSLASKVSWGTAKHVCAIKVMITFNFLAIIVSLSGIKPSFVYRFPLIKTNGEAVNEVYSCKVSVAIAILCRSIFVTTLWLFHSSAVLSSSSPWLQQLHLHRPRPWTRKT